jgi:hypothetical protein
MSKRRRTRQSSNSLLAIIAKDQYGLLWLALLILAVFILKWQVVQPPELEGSPCVLCVEILLWLLVVFVSLINAGLWWVWTSRAEKGLGLMFMLGISAVGSAFLANVIAHGMVEKLYYRGWLKWPEAQVSFLLDDFVSHAMGLFLATAVFYGMIRLAISKDLMDKKLVLFLSLGIALTSASLLFLGIKLY